jgi:hypothetical protein
VDCHSSAASPISRLDFSGSSCIGQFSGWTAIASWDILGADTDGEEFLRELDEILELAHRTLNGAGKLGELEHWNSMAMVSLIALPDNNGTTVSPRL